MKDCLISFIDWFVVKGYRFLLVLFSFFALVVFSCNRCILLVHGTLVWWDGFFSRWWWLAWVHWLEWSWRGQIGVCRASMRVKCELMNLFDKAPVVAKDAFVAPTASVIGDVKVGQRSSIWNGCVLSKDWNIGFYGYICTSILRIYRRNIGGCFFTNINKVKII